MSKKFRGTEQLLVEQLRATKLSQLILPERIMNVLKGGLSTHMLLYGLHGIGKTTVAQILTKDFDTLFVNVSAESSIDVLRTKVRDHCNKMGSLDDTGRNPRQKAVLLDEIDGGSDSFQNALKAFIEEYHKRGVRFIMTSNHIHKVNAGLKDRMLNVDFDIQDSDEEQWMMEQFIERTKWILSRPKVGLVPENDKVVEELVRAFFPSMRSIINNIDAIRKNPDIKVLTSALVVKMKFKNKDLYDRLLTNNSPDENYAYLKQYDSRTTDVLKSLGEGLINYILEERAEFTKHVPAITILVAKYQRSEIHTVDPFVNLLACFWEIQQQLSK